QRLTAATRMQQNCLHARTLEWITGGGASAGANGHPRTGIETPLIELNPDIVAIAIILSNEPQDDLPPKAIVLATKAVHGPKVRRSAGEGERPSATILAADQQRVALRRFQ